MPYLSIISCMDKNRLIGRDNALPWRLPADMRWFRANTLGKPVIMGRKTFESLKQPLKDRRNIIITRDSSYSAPNCDIVSSLDAAVEAVGPDVSDAMIIGGSSIYEQSLPRCQRLYLTEIDFIFEGDSYFPEFDLDQWHILEEQRHQKDEKNPYDYRFLLLERR